MKRGLPYTHLSQFLCWRGTEAPSGNGTLLAPKAQGMMMLPGEASLNINNNRIDIGPHCAESQSKPAVGPVSKPLPLSVCI